MKKKTKEIVVCCVEMYAVPDNLLEFCEFFQEKVDMIPEEYRDNADIDFDFDECSRVVIITYHRPETDEELQQRVGREQQKILDKKQKELALLEELKRKYENE